MIDNYRRRVRLDPDGVRGLRSRGEGDDESLRFIFCSRLARLRDIGGGIGGAPVVLKRGDISRWIIDRFEFVLANQSNRRERGKTKRSILERTWIHIISIALALEDTRACACVERAERERKVEFGGKCNRSSKRCEHAADADDDATLFRMITGNKTTQRRRREKQFDSIR